jgi:topoisomerase-4 subunit A
MVDLPNEAEIIDMFVHKPGQRLIVASAEGNGFVVNSDDVVAQTRAGKQVLNVGESVAKVCRPVAGDHVAVVSENRKLLVFPLEELPEMGRGKGVRLQKYNAARGKQGVLELDGGLSDLTTFEIEKGLSWAAGGDRTRTEVDMSPWLGKRASVGKLPPHGFPRDNRFTS